MRKNSRAYKLLQAGELAIQELTGAAPNSTEERLLLAFAAMLDAATAKPEAKKKAPLLYDEHAVLRTLNYDLVVTKHGTLNRILRGIQQRDDDLEKFEIWFRENMYPWMQANNVELTYSMLARKYPEWLEKSHQFKGNKSATVVENWR